jgi:hypothetical protein
MHLQSASNDAPVDPAALSPCANKITNGALGGTRTTHTSARAWKKETARSIWGTVEPHCTSARKTEAGPWEEGRARGGGGCVRALGYGIIFHTQGMEYPGYGIYI